MVAYFLQATRSGVYVYIRYGNEKLVRQTTGQKG